MKSEQNRWGRLLYVDGNWDGTWDNIVATLEDAS